MHDYCADLLGLVNAHDAVCCSVLQCDHLVSLYNDYGANVLRFVIAHGAVSCSVLQCAVSCSVLTW